MNFVLSWQNPVRRLITDQEAEFERIRVSRLVVIESEPEPGSRFPQSLPGGDDLGLQGKPELWKWS